jgi:hypothetical protein
MEMIMAAKRGHVVLTPTAKEPYKVVLELEGGEESEQPVPTMRDGEALIRRETPTPQARDKTHDQPPPGKGPGS